MEFQSPSGPHQTGEVLSEAFEAALRGDGAALEALLSILKTRYGQTVFKLLRSHRGVAHTATLEDIFQQSMVDFMEQIKTGSLAELPESERRNVVRYFQTLCDRKLEDHRKSRKDPLFKRQKQELHDGLTENKRVQGTPGIPGVETRSEEHLALLHREISALAPFDRLVIERHLARVPYSEISKETGKKVTTLEVHVTRIKQRIADRIARQSQTAKLHQDRAWPPDLGKSCLPTAEEILAAIGGLSVEVQTAIRLVHLEGGSVEQLATKLGNRGLEKAKARLSRGYELLSARLALPFPDSFDLITP